MTTYSERPQSAHHTDFLANNAQVLAITAFFAVCVVVFSVTTDTFLSEGNVLNILRQAAPLLIIAVAMTFVITTGGIDLSVGLPWPLPTL